MRVVECVIVPVVVVFALGAVSMAAQTNPVLQNPSASQNIVQPEGTTLGLSETAIGQSAPTLSTKMLNCLGLGFSNGNNSTSATGWSGCYNSIDTMNSAAPAISQMHSGFFHKTAIGDSSSVNYTYATVYGGTTAASDEGDEDVVIQSFQMGVISGTLEAPFMGYSSPIYDDSVPAGVSFIYYNDGGNGNVTTGFAAGGNLADLYLPFAQAPSASYTAYIFVASLNGAYGSSSASFTISQVTPITVAATAGLQTFTPTQFGTITVAPGQYIGLYVPTGYGDVYDGFTGNVAAQSTNPQPCVTGLVSAGTTTFTTGSVPQCGAGQLKAVLSVPGLGATQIVTGSVNCTGYCDNGTPKYFPAGGILLDKTQGGGALTLSGYTTTLGARTYTINSGSVATSSAIGQIIPSSCTNNGPGAWDVYTATSCNVTLSTGTFTTGSNVCIAGPFAEQVQVTSVGTPSAGVQSITFNTTKAYNGTPAAIVGQGGPCSGTTGELAIVASAVASSWPVAYPLIAYDGTNLFYANCAFSNCISGGNSPDSAIHLGQTFVATGSGTSLTVSSIPDSFLQVGDTISGSGVPSGTTITAQISGNTGSTGVYTTSVATTASASTCTVVLPVTTYPMAWIANTIGGTQGAAGLKTNTIPFASGDAIVGAPTSEFHHQGITLIMGQNTPEDGGNPSLMETFIDKGPVVSQNFERFLNQSGQAMPNMFLVAGGMNQLYYIANRPETTNGTLLFVQGNSLDGDHPYNIFGDDAAGTGGSGGSISFDDRNGYASQGFTFDLPVISQRAFYRESYGSYYELCDQGNSSTLSGCGGGGGVPSVNGITSAVTVAAGTGVSVGTSGSTVTVTNSAPLTTAGTEALLGASPYGLNGSGGVLYDTGNGQFAPDPGFMYNASADYLLMAPNGLSIGLGGSNAEIDLGGQSCGQNSVMVQLMAYDSGHGLLNFTDYNCDQAFAIFQSGDFWAEGSGTVEGNFVVGGSLTAQSVVSASGFAELGSISGFPNIGNLTLNGNTSDTTRLGLAGEYSSPNNLYLDVPTGGTFDFRIASTTATVKIGVNGVTTPGLLGPATAPTGSCSTNGVWVFSQDGHATFCASGTWVTKI